MSFGPDSALCSPGMVSSNFYFFFPAAGFNALFVTLDCPYLGRRLNEFRNKFSLPEGMQLPNLFPGVDITTFEDGNETMAYGSPSPR